MNEKLIKEADLILLRNGFDLNGKRVRRIKIKKGKGKRCSKNFIANKPLPEKFKKEHSELIKERVESDLSDGEYKVAESLSKLGLHFEREKPMKGLVNPKTGKPLFFDFYVPKYTLVIEFDGIFHYKNDEEPYKLIEQKCKDDIKNKFCRKKRIRLLRIPFWKKKRIDHIICEKIYSITNGK